MKPGRVELSSKLQDLAFEHTRPSLGTPLQRLGVCVRRKARRSTPGPAHSVPSANVDSSLLPAAVLKLNAFFQKLTSSSNNNKPYSLYKHLNIVCAARITGRASYLVFMKSKTRADADCTKGAFARPLLEPNTWQKGKAQDGDRSPST